MLHARPAIVCHLHNGPSDEVDDDLDDGDAAHPPVQQVVGVGADVEQADQGVVAAGEDDERDHVDDREGSRAAADLGAQRVLVLVLPVEDEHVRKVAGQIAGEEEGVEA